MEHGHAPYFSFRQQAAGTDRNAGGVARKHMRTAPVTTIPFQHRRHALLINEHRSPYAA
jgi:hypothetical protein